MAQLALTVLLAPLSPDYSLQGSLQPVASGILLPQHNAHPEFCAEVPGCKDWRLQLGLCRHLWQNGKSHLHRGRSRKTPDPAHKPESSNLCSIRNWRPKLKISCSSMGNISQNSNFLLFLFGTPPLLFLPSSLVKESDEASYSRFWDILVYPNRGLYIY